MRGQGQVLFGLADWLEKTFLQESRVCTTPLNKNLVTIIVLRIKIAEVLQYRNIPSTARLPSFSRKNVKALFSWRKKDAVNAPDS